MACIKIDEFSIRLKPQKVSYIVGNGYIVNNESNNSLISILDVWTVQDTEKVLFVLFWVD